MAKLAGIKGHQAVGLSSIGGSRVIQHWDIPDEKNQAKEALRGGKVDVLTLSPIYLPDEGIEKFAALALKHNPQIRVTVQEFWERWDVYEPTTRPPAKVDHNAITGEELRKRHAPYFKEMDEHLRNLNQKLGKRVLYVVPVGQAVIALREKIIAGQAPGLKTQEALFTDPLGHPTAPLEALAAYCHFAVVYRTNPVGLPLPAVLSGAKNPDWGAPLNRLLQELAWEAVIQHPLSGVKASEAVKKASKTEAKPAAKQPPGPKPTLADVPYGSHPKQVLDFYKADSAAPTPLVFHIHGGGWMGGSKAPFGAAGYLKAGISVVSIEYRFVSDAMAAGVKPPVEWPLHDAARALQFVRSKAGQWNIDKTRIGATGGSAGACSSLWLAFHDEMADPNSADPIARESTRLTCAAVGGAQTSLDPKQTKEWTPNSNYGGHAFGFKGDPKKGLSQFQQFLEGRETILPWIKEYSPYELVTADDPPIFLSYGSPPALGQAEKDPTHSANFGLKLQEKCRRVGVECYLAYPGAADLKYRNINEFLIAKLKGKGTEKK
jgi:acetyl esterase/lipase